MPDVMIQLVFGGFLLVVAILAVIDFICNTAIKGLNLEKLLPVGIASFIGFVGYIIICDALNIPI